MRFPPDGSASRIRLMLSRVMLPPVESPGAMATALCNRTLLPLGWTPTPVVTQSGVEPAVSADRPVCGATSARARG